MLFIREVTLSSSSCSNISSIHNNRSAPLKCIPTRSTWIAILVDWLPDCLLSKYKYEQRNNEVEEEGGEYLEIAQDLPLYCLSSSALWEVEAALLRCDWCRYRKSSGFISGDKKKIFAPGNHVPFIDICIGWKAAAAAAASPMPIAAYWNVPFLIGFNFRIIIIIIFTLVAYGHSLKSVNNQCPYIGDK